jgi:hypothetical protein
LKSKYAIGRCSVVSETDCELHVLKFKQSLIRVEHSLNKIPILKQ